MRATPENTCDAVVLGGGPAGATAATLLAQDGHHVVLLERERLPRFKIGESLMPETYWTLAKLGMLDQLRQSASTVKASVQFIAASGKASKPFYFFEREDHESAYTWQVERAWFDQALVANAEAKGVDVRMGVTATEVLFDERSSRRRSGSRPRRERHRPEGPGGRRRHRSRLARLAPALAPGAQPGAQPRVHLRPLRERRPRRGDRRGRDARRPHAGELGLVLVHPFVRQSRERRNRGAAFETLFWGARPPRRSSSEPSPSVLPSRAGSPRPPGSAPWASRRTIRTGHAASRATVGCSSETPSLFSTPFIRRACFSP